MASANAFEEVSSRMIPDLVAFLPPAPVRIVPPPATPIVTSKMGTENVILKSNFENHPLYFTIEF